MNRRLIIISNAGTKNDLVGIDKDVSNYCNFFSSPEGGLWNFSKGGDAVCFKTNKITANEFLEYIRQEAASSVDYWVIAFAGHGGSDPNKVDVLEVCPEQKGVKSDCSIKEIRQAMGRNTRAVLISDCCRSPIPAYEHGGQISESMFSAITAEGEQYRVDCRKLYDQHFMMVPLGTFFLAQACSYGECSNGFSKGGYYSYHLLKQANTIIEEQKKHYRDSDYQDTVFSLSYVHTLAAPYVEKQADRSGEDQHPEYSGPRCNQPPFCVIARNKRRLIFG